MNALNVLCAQLTRDLFTIAKLLFISKQPKVGGPGIPAGHKG